MLRMSRLADYAFVILAKMASIPEKNWSAPALAQATTLPLPTVAKLMKVLARGAFVAAQRGTSGGYRLAQAAEAISVVSVLEAVDGPVCLTLCANSAHNEAPKTRVCVARKECLVCGNWGKINASVRAALGAVHVSDLVSTRKEGGTT